MGQKTHRPSKDVMNAQRRDALMGGEVEKWIRVIGLPKPEIANLIGIGQTSLYEKLRSPGEFRVQELRVIADLAGVPVSQLVE